jgi:AraC-like DNA-binding protein
MPPAGDSRSKIDIYGLQTRLVWANERVIEDLYRDMDKTESTQETVAWFIEEGDVTVSYAHTKIRATKNQWLFLRADQGCQHFSKGARLISLRFHLLLRGGKPLFARKRDLLFEGTAAARLTAAARRLVAEFTRLGVASTLSLARSRISLVDNFRVEGAFMDWLAAYVDAMEAAGETAEAADERDPRVGKALIAIEDHRMRDKFTEADLARHCGLSINQLGRLFRRELGMSPFQYYEQRRLELARHTLAESALPVKEICFELGFSSPPHFSSWFTEHEGLSPRAWRTARQKKTPGMAQPRSSSA